ncbi:hypothetical protein NDU88_002114 [Pleurodeles waltl]|uniref:Uncharacterized protein n=1 Tax=Pleurodeles waltl TaxID=8319 RepID=A0AAV7U8H3_PLEWA|nr:hypothetical protein NDU88_002114 [Pleurodeles waltl]
MNRAISVDMVNSMTQQSEIREAAGRTSRAGGGCRNVLEGRGTWRPVEALTANSHRTRDADERRDLRPLTWKRRAESRSSPAVGSTRERITAAVEGPPCCDEEEVWRRDAGEETRGETGIVQGS